MPLRRRNVVHRAVPLAATFCAAAALACSSAGLTESSSSMAGVYVLASVDGASPPTILSSGLAGTLRLVAARYVFHGADRVSMVRVLQFTPSGEPSRDTVTDSILATFSRRGSEVIVRDGPYADTGLVESGVSTDGVLTVRTRFPGQFVLTPKYLVYGKR